MSATTRREPRLLSRSRRTRFAGPEGSPRGALVGGGEDRAWPPSLAQPRRPPASPGSQRGGCGMCARVRARVCLNSQYGNLMASFKET